MTLAAWLTVGSSDAGDRWRDVRRACADRGLCERDPRDDGPRVRLRPPPAPKAPEPPKRAPIAEVAALWEACLPLTEARDPVVYLAGEGWTVDEIATVQRLDLARATPDVFAWPSWWPGDRWRPWRLIAPAFDAAGKLASLHARRVDGGSTPKTRWPRGPEAGGLLFADGRGVRFLRGEFSPGVEAVMVCEGLTDTLRTAARVALHGWPWAVLGMTEGSKDALLALGSRWPDGLPLYVGTDEDPKGEKYAADVRRAMPRRVRVRRVMPSKVMKGMACNE